MTAPLTLSRELDMLKFYIVNRAKSALFEAFMTYCRRITDAYLSGRLSPTTFRLLLGAALILPRPLRGLPSR